MRRLWRWLLFAVLAAGLGAGRTARGQDCRPCGPEGRNGPLALLIPQGSHGADFRPACEAHDACYGTPGISRAQCDRQFLHDLLTACELSSNPALCRITARNMGRATRWGGTRAFQRAQGWR